MVRATLRLNFGLAIIVLAFFLPTVSMARRPVVKIKVQSDLRSELNGVLKASVDLQESSFQRNEQSASQNMKKLISRISSAEKKSHLAKAQRTHIVKILN